MKEDFLHFIWQYQYFNKEALKTDDAESIQVIYPGAYNTNAGPDFFGAKLKIGKMEWCGNIEIHIHSSDWYNHNHHHNGAYDNTILHVVWKRDKAVYRKDGSLISCIELQKRVDHTLISKYNSLLNNIDEFPCKKLFHTIDEIRKIDMIEKSLMDRLQRKALQISGLLKENNFDWEETVYQVIASCFGFKINSDSFLRLSKLLPFKILIRNSDQLFKVEALIFGTAGLLERNFTEEYPDKLKKEYAFLSKKYSLASSCMQDFEWKFLRTRPSNFPSVRMAQLASLIHKKKNIFSTIIEADEILKWREIFLIRPSEYWKNHYVFERSTHINVPLIGKESIDNILINGIAPLLISYSIEKDSAEYMQRAVDLLEGMLAENNKITAMWKRNGLNLKTAFDSQGAVELYNSYCLKKKCLNCSIGNLIMRQ